MKRLLHGMTLRGLVLVLSLLALPLPLSAYDVYHDTYYSAKGDRHFNRLLNRVQFDRLDSTAVYRLQQNLATVYHNDLNWRRDLRLSQHPLTDGRIGPVTLFWLQRFAHDFKIDIIGNYADGLLARLEKIAEFADMFPDETAILLSADFAKWNDRESDIQRTLDYEIRRQGTVQQLLDLVDRYRSLNESAYRAVSDDYPTSPLYYYQLSEADFAMLQSRVKIIAALAKLENKAFENSALLQAALTEIFKDHLAFLTRMQPAINKFFSAKPLVMSTEFIAFIDRAIVGDPLLPSLHKTLAGLLKRELGGVTFPEQNLFASAVRAKLFAATGVCASSRLHNQYVLSLRLGDEDFLELETDLLNNAEYHGMPDIRRHLELIHTLRKGEKTCGREDRADVTDFAKNLYDHVVLPAIARLYRKQPAFDASAMIAWDGDGCGCVLDKLSGTVYGFYPYWLANGERQIVNFSVLTRVAYYGLSFGKNGGLLHANDDENKFDLDRFLKNSLFIETARKYNSQVDWVIHKDRAYWEESWQQLDASQKANILATLADDIYALLIQPLNATLAQWTFDLIPLPTRGDGVTLDFRGYPQDAVSVDLFNHFFNDLKTRLEAVSSDYFVNILASQAELGSGIYRYFNLLERVSGIQSNDAATSYQHMDIRDDMNTKILVLLEEPTTQAKKQLRLAVENSGLYGTLRGIMLRNIIPVMAFDGHNWEQLEDDIVYFKDNFGGTGFWPMPLDDAPMPEVMSGRCEEMKSVTGCLVRHFQHEQRDGQPDSVLDRFVCENRMVFWVVLMVLTALSVALILYLRRACGLGERKRHWTVIGLYAVAVPASIVAILLLTFDPMLEKLSEGNLPLIAVIVVGITGSIIYYRRQQSKARKPSRPKLTAASASKTVNRYTPQS